MPAGRLKSFPGKLDCRRAGAKEHLPIWSSRKITKKRLLIHMFSGFCFDSDFDLNFWSWYYLCVYFSFLAELFQESPWGSDLYKILILIWLSLLSGFTFQTLNISLFKLFYFPFFVWHIWIFSFLIFSLWWLGDFWWWFVVFCYVLRDCMAGALCHARYESTPARTTDCQQGLDLTAPRTELCWRSSSRNAVGPVGSLPDSLLLRRKFTTRARSLRLSRDAFSVQFLSSARAVRILRASNSNCRTEPGADDASRVMVSAVQLAAPSMMSWCSPRMRSAAAFVVWG